MKTNNSTLRQLNKTICSANAPEECRRAVTRQRQLKFPFCQRTTNVPDSFSEGRPRTSVTGPVSHGEIARWLAYTCLTLEEDRAQPVTGPKELTLRVAMRFRCRMRKKPRIHIRGKKGLLMRGSAPAARLRLLPNLENAAEGAAGCWGQGINAVGRRWVSPKSGLKSEVLWYTYSSIASHCNCEKNVYIFHS
jgi:hypothetical protein